MLSNEGAPKIPRVFFSLGEESPTHSDIYTAEVITPMSPFFAKVRIVTALHGNLQQPGTEVILAYNKMHRVIAGMDTRPRAIPFDQEVEQILSNFKPTQPTEWKGQVETILEGREWYDYTQLPPKPPST